MTNIKDSISRIYPRKNWIFGIIILVFALNLFFSVRHIEKFAAVDEPLWLFGRIEGYWNSIKAHQWSGTLVSDKPGITVALISGIGLIYENPKDFEPIAWQGRLYRQRSDIETLYRAMRLPIAIFSAFCLFLFYFLLQKLFSKQTAAFAVILLGTSPILIGMARIINPDSLLWIFSALAILAYLVYLKNQNRRYLFSAGILLGLALLTKYVANILLIFFLALIFLEYVFNQQKYAGISPSTFLKNSFRDYLLLCFSALLTFFILCPAAWIQPQILLQATFLSQAFASTWPFFAGFLLFLALDTLLLKNFFFTPLFVFLQKNRRLVAWLILLVFLLPVVFTLINVQLEMKFINFDDVLSSPKSSHKLNLASLVTYFANYYPLVFGISPIALLVLFLALGYELRQQDFSEELPKILIYLIFFILLYYLGSAVTNVAAMVRYQIMVYPIALIAAGIALGMLWEKISSRNKSLLGPLLFFLLAITVIPLFHIQPFFSSYNSVLLPEKYFIDLKDMGAGSYEAAQFLNSLPDAENTAIWTDKSGVCYFFKGLCFSGYDKKELANANLRYAVVSAGRENRSDKMARGNKNSPLYFSKYYAQTENVAYWLKLDGRPNQFVKVIKLN